MSSTEIRNAITAKLQSVDNIGIVHGFQRYTRNDNKFRTLYEVDGSVHGWTVRRIGFSEVAYTATVNLVKTRWRIEGVRSLNDEAATEIAFDELVDLISDVFRSDQTLGGAVVSTGNRDEAPIQLEDAGPAMFAGVLCHQARLALTTEHYVSYEVAEEGVVPDTVYASRAPKIGADHKFDYRDVQTGEPPDE